MNWAATPRNYPVAERPDRRVVSDMALGLAMQKLARDEGHRPGLPDFAPWTAKRGRPTNKDRILAAMTTQGQSSKAIARTAGIHWQTVRMALSELRKAGKVDTTRVSHGYLWRLP